MTYDVVIAGGGPAGLAAALTLGRSRKRVLLCDAGPRRNAAAVHLHNFVTRDGITPAEFRRIGRQQLEPYAHVETREARIEEVRGTRGSFDVRLSTGSIKARRILLCTGMVDESPEIEGLGSLWGKSIFICPYCHAWEVQNRRFAYLATSLEKIDFALLLRGWASDVIVLTQGRLNVPDDVRARLKAGGVQVDDRPIARLVPASDGLEMERIEFTDGSSIERDVLFLHPPQHQIEIVTSLGLALDAAGYVQLDPVTLETSVPGVYAAGDLLAPMQGALIAAASGTLTAGVLNHALTVELAIEGLLA
ncbi:MAG: NAD(P)/FAD-dependent oxidoreductase [Acidobacteriota bacterium]|nr:NAD(P)/FAD-dependent oxidoreductase [Acidobacteriota bacterium]MDQ3421126.1 NAD(P)/FAD-dependent oxidoreductase [Acidobacteriota bacterium]